MLEEKQIITLQRTIFHAKGTFGVFLDQNLYPFAVTMEEVNRDNVTEFSCIPEGMYLCLPYKRTNGQDAFEVQDVPNRTNILIHAANTINDVEGCIGPGKYFGEYQNLPAVLDSLNTMGLLVKRVKNEAFWLRIINP